MRSMSGVVFGSVQAMSPAPVFRAFEAVSAFRLVSGQECSGSAAAAWQMESVSGVGLAGAADLLGLIALGEGLLAHGYAGEQPLDGGSSVSEQDGDNNSSKRDDSSKRDGDKGDNGTKPVNPWDFRTSSPPG